MTPLLETVLSNVLMAAALAVPAALAGWWGRRPALTHGLWLLVLAKLVTPPLFHVPVAWPDAAASTALDEAELAPVEPQPELLAEPVVAEMRPSPAPLDAEEPPLPIVLPDAPIESGPPAEPAPLAAAIAPPAESALPWTTWLLLPWLAGTVAWLFVVTRRLERFQRLLRFARPASDAVQDEARTLARRLGVRCPRVVTLPGTLSPMFLAGGRAPRVLLPEGLIERLSAAQRTTLLAHELAHWRRGDHRIRWLEVLVLALYWWCPLAWWARGQLRQAEEECCDAWVVALLPDAARDYALALVETIDFLSGAAPALPPAASGAGHVRLLQRRLTMILRGSTPQSLTRAGLLALAGLALVLLPFVPGLAQPPPIQAPAADGERGFAAPGSDPLGDLRNRQLIEKQQAQQESEQANRHLALQRAVLAKQLQEVQRTIAEVNAKQAAMRGIGPVIAAKSVSVEQRLEQIERKLDALLWEITSLRRDMARKHLTPGVPGGSMPPSGFPGKSSTPPSAPPLALPGSGGAAPRAVGPVSVNPGPYLGGGPVPRAVTPSPPALNGN